VSIVKSHFILFFFRHSRNLRPPSRSVPLPGGRGPLVFSLVTGAVDATVPEGRRGGFPHPAVDVAVRRRRVARARRASSSPTPGRLFSLSRRGAPWGPCAAPETEDRGIRRSPYPPLSGSLRERSFSTFYSILSHLI